MNTPDFRAFATKLSDEAMEKVRFESITFLKEICHIIDLRPKMEEAKTCGILSALLLTIGTKQTVETMYNPFEIKDK